MFKLKYPKFALLTMTFILAYIIFSNRDFVPMHTLLKQLGYFGTFLAGMGFTYGFTSAPATAILLILSKDQNILLAGLLGGLGALVSDLMIFAFIRNMFADEIKKLSKERIIRKLNHNHIIRKYFMPIIAGFIIASPLPDEIGITMFAASRNISLKIFSIISYLLNTAGIFVILLIGKAI